MTEESLGSERVQRCPICSGVFVSGHILNEVRAHSVLHLHKTANAVPTPIPSRITCPNDSGQMVAITYKGIEIDVCPKCHGVWLDPGELEKITMAVRPPSRPDLAKINSKLDEIEGNIDIVDSLSNIDVSGQGDVVGFVGDAIGSVLDGISF
jgi:Zn-finger nucleic acid-binding protein